MEISYTMVNTFNLCPVRYAIKYIFHERELRNPFLVLGQMLHETIPQIREVGYDTTLKLFIDNYKEWWDMVDIRSITEQDFVNLFNKMFGLIGKVMVRYLNKEVKLENKILKSYKDESLVGKIDYLASDLLLDFKFKKNFLYLKPTQLDFYRYLTGFEGKQAYLVFTWDGESELIESKPRTNIPVYVNDFLKRKDTDRKPNLKNCKLCPYVEVCKVSPLEGYESF